MKQLVRLLFWLILCGIPDQTRAAEPTLRWAADAQGGAPFILPDPKNPSRYIGFEVEIAEALARQMRRKAVFVQNQWDGLIPGLQAGNYDIALNGIEITPEHAREVLFSLPYYATAEQLTVRMETSDVSRLDDLQGKAVGTLKASLAQRILEEFNAAHPPGIRVVTYDDQNTAYEDLILRRTEAVLMDFPIAQYCADPARLKHAGPPIGRIRYGVAIRKTRPALQSEINRALTELIRSGELRAIYQRWGLWNPETRSLFQEMFPDAVAAVQGETPAANRELIAHQQASFQPLTITERLHKYVFVYLPILLTRGAGMTLALSITGMALAIAGGLLLTVANLVGPAPIRGLARAFIELVRGTPLLIQLYLIYYGLPRIGIQFSPFVAAVLGLGVNYAAYEAENFRAGVQSVPQDQWEAGGTCGMSPFQVFRHIILPQATRLIIPPVTNDFVSLLKDSSIVSVITMVELTKTFGELAQINFDFIGLGLLTALVYFLLGLPFVRLARYIERRYGAHA